jgi:lipopolysaccharide cholinephosphotransferase
MGKRDKPEQSLFRQLKDKFRPPLNFTGRYYGVACRLLRDTAEILNSAGITYFLDAGALLGLMRNGDLIPWDHDLDFLMPVTELKKFQDTFPEFRRRHWRVTMDSLMPADGPAWQKGHRRCVTIRNRNAIYVGRGRLVMDVSLLYKKKGHYYRGAMGKIWRIPGKFLDAHEFVEFVDRNIMVPAHTAEYLSYIYGDWKKPAENWDPVKQDGSYHGDLYRWPHDDEEPRLYLRHENINLPKS